MGRIGKFLIGGVLIGVSLIFGGPLGATVAGLMLSAGVSLATAAIFQPGPVSLSERQGGILSNFPSNLSPLPIVYGQTLLGIRPVDIRAAGVNNKDLWIVGALCHGSADGNGIQSIDEIYFDGVLAIDAAGVIQSPFSGVVAFVKYLGTFAQNVSTLSIGGTTLNTVFATNWPTSSKGHGIAGLVLRLTYDPDVFGTGSLPNITAKVKGCKVVDVRVGGAAAYSTNPALCLYNYLTSSVFGLGADASEIDGATTGAFATEATFCDALVTSPEGNIKRFEMNGWLDVGRSVQENITQMLTSCRGNLVYESGKFRLFIRKSQLPVAFALNTDNIIGDWSFKVPGLKERANQIKATYLNPDFDKFNADQVQYPSPGATNTYLTDDASYLVEHEIELPMTINKNTAWQIANVALKEQRAGIGLQVTCKEEALKLQVGDVVNVTHPTPGWVTQPFWVVGIVLLPDGTVRVLGIKYDDNAYTLDAQTTLPSHPATTLPNPYASCAAPTNFNVVSGDAEADPDADGSHKVYMRATWDSAAEPYLDYYEVTFRKSGTEKWVPAPIPNRTDTEIQIGPVSEGTSYDVRVRTINTRGIPSTWAEDTIVPFLPTLQRSGSFWIDDFSSRTPGRRWVQKGGTGSFVDVYDPDALVGGKLGRATGPVHMEHADSIPFDQNILYIIRWRVRQLRNPVVGTKAFSIGVAGVAQEPGSPDSFTYVNVVGSDSIDNQHYVVANGDSLPADRDFKDYFAYIKGYAGGKFPLTAAMLSHSGLGSFSAANLVDGNTLPTQVGFSASSAAAGSYLKFDLVTPKNITECRFHMAAEGSVDQWQLQFSDDGTNWTNAS